MADSLSLVNYSKRQAIASISQTAPDEVEEDLTICLLKLGRILKSAI
jgi:hypothetical protein